MNRNNYLYASGLIRTLENKMPDPTDIERMTDASGFSEAFKVFNDTDYADNLLDVEAKDFNKTLEDDFVQLKDLFFHIVPDKILLKIIFYQYDFHNIKLCFKEKYSEKNLEEHFSPLGISDYQKIKKNIVNEEREELPKEIEETIKYIKQQIGEKEALPHLIDRWADQKYFETICNLSQKTNNVFMKKLVLLQIDMVNLKNFIRGKRMNRKNDYILSELLPNGNISLKEFKELMEKPLEEGIGYLRKYFSKDASRFIDDFLEKKNLWELERNLENLEMNFIRQSKFIAYGPEVVLEYYYAKKNANRNVRLIVTAKLSNIKSEEIKQRTRELF